jgi:hypothetical protein
MPQRQITNNDIYTGKESAILDPKKDTSALFLCIIRITSSHLDTQRWSKVCSPSVRGETWQRVFSFSLYFFMLLQFVLAASIDSSNCTPASTAIEIINALARVNIEDKNSEYILTKSKITINLDLYLKVMCLV